MPDTVRRRIATMKPDARLDLLDDITRRHRDNALVIDYETARDTGITDTVIGFILGVAYAPNGSTSQLIVQPLRPDARLHAVSLATLIRITRHRTGEHVAGMPAPTPEDTP